MRAFAALIVLAVCLSACDGPGTVTVLPTTPVAPAQTSRIALVPSPPELPIGGGSAVISVETTEGGSRVAPNVSVELSASHGTLSRTQVVTDSTGHTTVDWSGTETATIAARVGDVTGSAELRVLVPPPSIPPSNPRPTPAPPPPLPLPTPTPQPEDPIVTVTPQAPTTPVGIDTTFSVSVTRLASGETILAYEWDFDLGAGPTTDAMTTAPATLHEYSRIGVYTVRVIARTSQRTVIGTTTIVVTAD